MTTTTFVLDADTARRLAALVPTLKGSDPARPVLRSALVTNSEADGEATIVVTDTYQMLVATIPVATWDPVTPFLLPLSVLAAVAKHKGADAVEINADRMATGTTSVEARAVGWSVSDHSPDADQYPDWQAAYSKAGNGTTEPLPDNLGMDAAKVASVAAAFDTFAKQKGRRDTHSTVTITFDGRNPTRWTAPSVDGAQLSAILMPRLK